MAQKILPSTVDDVLQPDAMRGSEQHLKDVDIIDLEQERRDDQEAKSKPATKPASAPASGTATPKTS